MRKDYIMDVSMIGLDGNPRLYDKVHPCITSRLFKEPTMIISIERVDMNIEYNTIPKRREEKRREEKMAFALLVAWITQLTTLLKVLIEYMTLTELHPQLIHVVAVGYNQKSWRLRNWI